MHQTGGWLPAGHHLHGGSEETPHKTLLCQFTGWSGSRVGRGGWRGGGTEGNMVPMCGQHMVVGDDRLKDL